MEHTVLLSTQFCGVEEASDNTHTRSHTHTHTNSHTLTRTHNNTHTHTNTHERKSLNALLLLQANIYEYPYRGGGTTPSVRLRGPSLSLYPLFSLRPSFSKSFLSNLNMRVRVRGREGKQKWERERRREGERESSFCPTSFSSCHSERMWEERRQSLSFSLPLSPSVTLSLSLSLYLSLSLTLTLTRFFSLNFFPSLFSSLSPSLGGRK